jgi:carbonic anhydrase
MNEILPALMPLIFFFGITVLIVALVVFVKRIQSKRAKERTEQFQRAASLLGWQFVPAAAMNWLPNLEQFTLFSEGHSKTITNAMYGETDGVKSALFDYEYVVGSGKNRTIYRQSVVYFESADLNLPFFSLRQENALYKLISAFGYQDIDFGNRPEFSKRYLLRGPDEAAVRGVFNDVVFAFYETNKGTSTDGGGNQLFVFRLAHRIAPLEAQSFVNWALQVKNLFGRRW